MKAPKLWLAAAFSGLLLSLSWPEIGNFSPLLFVALIPMLWVEDTLYQRSLAGKRTWALWLHSYSAFFLFNIITTWWIVYASLFGAVMAIIFNSLFMTVIFHLFHLTRKKVGSKEGYFGLIFYWIAWEYLHMRWDLTWPWLTLGNGFSTWSGMIQWYEYTGVPGGSLWVLLSNIVGLQLFKTWQKENISGLFKKQVAILAGLIIIPIAISQLIYHNYEIKGEEKEVVVIQPNIDPYGEKFTLSADEMVAKMLSLAAPLITEETDYVVGPETALPRSIREENISKSSGFRLLKNFVALNPQTQIVIGLMSRTTYENEAELTATARKYKDAELWYDKYNTAMQVDTSANVPLYHKSKLVPGVERMPFPALFKHLDKFAIDLGGTTGSLGTQDERTVFFSPKDSVGIAPVICYESIYGEFVSDYVLNGADLIFIITNDGWWDDTPGYRQHLSYAKLRAIETRRSIARSANTGTSCFIDQKGDIHQATDWWVPTAIKAKIPANSELTFYTLYGDYIARIALLFSGLLLLLTIVRWSTKKELAIK